MADGGWIGIAIPEEYGGGGRGILEAAAVLQTVAASGAAMNGASALHMSIFGMQPGHPPRRRPTQAALPAVGGRRQPARGVRGHRARRRHRHHSHHHPGSARRRPVRDQRPQGVDQQGAGGRPHPAAHPHHPTRRVPSAHRRDDAVPRRQARPRRRASRRSRRWAATRWRRARPPTTTWWCRRPTASATRATASATCSTGSTPSACSSPPRPSASATRRCGWPSTTPRSGWCSAGRSARTRASRSRWPRPTHVSGPPS